MKKKISINTASFEEIQKLRGIGQVKAARIVGYRDGSGSNFHRPEDLEKVEGISRRLAQELAPHISFDVSDDEQGSTRLAKKKNKTKHIALIIGIFAAVVTTIASFIGAFNDTFSLIEKINNSSEAMSLWLTNCPSEFEDRGKIKVLISSFENRGGPSQ
jgi:competence ComEA-like helix-hairpin-helix protein